jgi:hypothetical protein
LKWPLAGLITPPTLEDERRVRLRLNCGGSESRQSIGWALSGKETPRLSQRCAGWRPKQSKKSASRRSSRFRGSESVQKGLSWLARKKRFFHRAL